MSPLRTFGPDRMQPELEPRDHAEVAAAALERPEEVGVLGGARAHDADPSRSRPRPLSRLSTVMPYLRLSQPKPPPSVSPAIPVVELMPTGVARPWACVAASRSASVAPPSMVARRRPVSTCAAFIRDRSTTSPSSQIALPAMLCPPPRAASRSPLSRAKLTARIDVRRRGAARDDGGALVDHRVPDLARVVVGAVARQGSTSALRTRRLFSSSIFPSVCDTTRHGGSPSAMATSVRVLSESADDAELTSDRARTLTDDRLSEILDRTSGTCRGHEPRHPLRRAPRRAAAGGALLLHRRHFALGGGGPPAREIIPAIMPGAEHMIEFHGVVEGSCWARHRRGAAAPPGRAGRHPLSARRSARRVERARPPRRRAWTSSVYFAPRPPQLPYALSLHGSEVTTARLDGGGGDRAVIVCGFLGLDARPFNPLLAALPRVLHVAGATLGLDSWVASFLRVGGRWSRTSGGRAARRCWSA